MRDTLRKKKYQISPSRRTLSPVFAENLAEQKTNGTQGRRQSFTRSRSPHIRTTNSSGPTPHPTMSAPMSHARHRTPPISYSLLPGELSLHIPVPLIGLIWAFSADARSLAESLLLLGSLFYANRKLASAFGLLHIPNPSVSSGKSLALIPSIYAHHFTEIDILIAACIIYVIWSHSSFVKKAPTPPPSDVDDVRAPSPRIESRESRRGGGTRLSQNRTHFGFVWMSVPKNFRYVDTPRIRTYCSLHSGTVRTTVH